MNNKKTNELEDLKQDLCVAGGFAAPMTILSLGSLIITVRNPEAISIMCTIACLVPAIHTVNEFRKCAKKYAQIKRER